MSIPDYAAAKSKFREVCAAGPGFAEYLKGKIEGGKVSYYQFGKSIDCGCFWYHVGSFFFPEKIDYTNKTHTQCYNDAKKRFVPDNMNIFETCELMLGGVWEAKEKSLARYHSWCCEWIAENRSIPTVTAPIVKPKSKRTSMLIQLARFFREDARIWKARYFALKAQIEQPETIEQILEEVESK